jgi:hypothetical protein
MNTMKVQLPHPEHYTYKVHRRQAISQVFLPVILAGLLIIVAVVLVSLATFQGGADVNRWAAISMIWIAIPLILGGLVFLVLFIGLIYLNTRLLSFLPKYTGLAQGYAYRIRGTIIHAADLAVKPIIGLSSFLARVEALLGRD